MCIHSGGFKTLVCDCLISLAPILSGPLSYNLVIAEVTRYASLLPLLFRPLESPNHNFPILTQLHRMRTFVAFVVGLASASAAGIGRREYNVAPNSTT